LVTVRAPASTSNIGPGFDCLGAAVSIGLEVRFTAGSAARSPGLVERAAELVLGRPLEGAVEISSDIPSARGLGSSAACVAAGLLIGCTLAGREPDAGELLALGTPLEGHPDNLAAALYGGITLVLPGGVVQRLEPSASVRPLIVVPHERLATAEARAVLPETVPLRDAVANTARTAGLVTLLTGVVEPTRERLLACTEDLLHQPYRAPLMPKTADALRRLREAGVPAAVSGAGPSIVCLVGDGEQDSTREAVGILEGWQLLDLDWETRGAYAREE
jgi:homoserine kinase